MEAVKHCEYCGEAFTRASNRTKRYFEGQRFCSIACSNRAVRRGQAKNNAWRKLECKICLACGLKFRPRWNEHETQWRNRLCCSLRCGALWRRGGCEAKCNYEPTPDKIEAETLRIRYADDKLPKRKRVAPRNRNEAVAWATWASVGDFVAALDSIAAVARA